MPSEPTPWWVSSLSSFVISIVVFGLGYFLVYRRQLGPQLRHLNAQLQDRDAALQARQAPRALEIAKFLIRWANNALGDYESPQGLWAREAPTPEIVEDAARLANDPLLRDQLRRIASLLSVAESTPELWVNCALEINRNAQLSATLGKVTLGIGSDYSDPSNFTEAQWAYLEPRRKEWVRARDSWGVAAEELRELGVNMRDRAEELLRATIQD